MSRVNENTLKPEGNDFQIVSALCYMSHSEPEFTDPTKVNLFVCVVPIIVYSALLIAENGAHYCALVELRSRLYLLVQAVVCYR
jgi:hypothetical protein